MSRVFIEFVTGYTHVDNEIKPLMLHYSDTAFKQLKEYLEKKAEEQFRFGSVYENLTEIESARALDLIDLYEKHFQENLDQLYTTQTDKST